MYRPRLCAGILALGIYQFENMIDESLMQDDGEAFAPRQCTLLATIISPGGSIS